MLVGPVLTVAPAHLRTPGLGADNLSHMLHESARAFSPLVPPRNASCTRGTGGIAPPVLSMMHVSCCRHVASAAPSIRTTIT